MVQMLHSLINVHHSQWPFTLTFQFDFGSFTFEWNIYFLMNLILSWSESIERIIDSFIANAVAWSRRWMNSKENEMFWFILDHLNGIFDLFYTSTFKIESIIYLACSISWLIKWWKLWRCFFYNL